MAQGSVKPGGRGTLIALSNNRGPLLLAAALLALAPSSGAVELSGHLAFEPRGFTQSPAHPGQSRHGLSLAFSPSSHHAFDDGRRACCSRRSCDSTPRTTGARTSTCGSCWYQRVFEASELRIGIGRVFWGVTESRHLVDVVNQTDLVRERRSRGQARQPLRQPHPHSATGHSRLLRAAGVSRADLSGAGGAPALRAVRRYGPRHLRVRCGPAACRPCGAVVTCESGISTSASPTSTARAGSRGSGPLPVCADGRPALASGCRPAGAVLAPRYDVVHRTSLDLQATRDAMLWKLEALHESGQGDSYLAWVAGFEYTWFGIDESGTLGLLVEHLFDGRGGNAPQPLENDVFRGRAPCAQRRGRHRFPRGRHRRCRRRRDDPQPRSVATHRRALEGRARGASLDWSRRRRPDVPAPPATTTYSSLCRASSERTSRGWQGCRDP